MQSNSSDSSTSSKQLHTLWSTMVSKIKLLLTMQNHAWLGQVALQQPRFCTAWPGTTKWTIFHTPWSWHGKIPCTNTSWIWRPSLRIWITCLKAKSCRTTRMHCCRQCRILTRRSISLSNQPMIHRGGGYT